MEKQENLQTFDTGSVRNQDAANVRYDLISPVGLRRLAETCSEGSKKYGDRNWEKGQPASELLNRTLKHVNDWIAGDRSEDHLAHAAWNLFALMHFEERMPEMLGDHSK